MFAETINYHDCLIRPRRLDIAESKIDAIRQLQYPTTQTEIRSFLRLCNVFERFVPNILRVAAPLNNKLCKDQPKSFLPFTVEKRQAAEPSKDLLTNLPVLALPRVTVIIMSTPRHAVEKLAAPCYNNNLEDPSEQLHAGQGR